MKKVLLSLVLLAGLLLLTYVLAPQAPLPASAGGYLDMHVHAACLGYGDNDCFISPGIRESYKFGFYLEAFDVSLEELETHGDEIIVAKLAAKIDSSERVSRAVVLALDGVVGDDGELDLERTQVYVPNAFVRRTVAAHDNLLYGASIHPRRLDALEQLTRAKADGAVLLKWIPCIMGIDPAEVSLTPFYRKLVDLDLPLLSHAGQERSFGESLDELCDPVRLRLALDLGVTVIAAHIATTGANEGSGNFERLLPMFAEYPNLYTDVSSLTQINKLGYLDEALRHGGVVERMVYGSDWPLQIFPLVSPWFHVESLSFPAAKRVSRQANQWDRDVLLKHYMGVPDAVFERSAALLLAR